MGLLDSDNHYHGYFSVQNWRIKKERSTYCPECFPSLFSSSCLIRVCSVHAKSQLACFRLSDSGKTRKKKARKKLAGREKGKRKGEIVDSSISRAWTPHAISLSDRNDPLWECWCDLSKLTNQRVYQQLVYLYGSFKEMITGSVAPAIPSFLPFYFRVCAFSIQRPPDYLGDWNRLKANGVSNLVRQHMLEFTSTAIIDGNVLRPYTLPTSHQQL